MVNKMGGEPEIERPFDLLGALTGKTVKVDHTNGDTITGTLTAWDPHINLVLDDVEPRRERLERKLEAKEVQIASRTELYQNMIGRLKRELRELNREMNLLQRTSPDRPRLEERRDELTSNLESERRRFQRVLRELEDDRMDIIEELEELGETQNLADVWDFKSPV